MLVDTHCHLNFEPLKSDVPGVLKKARERGVTRVVVPAYDLASWGALGGLRSHEGVELALGLHPWVAFEPLDDDALEKCAVDLQAVAIGEIGLDFKVAVSKERQIEVFERQLAVAARLSLPVILHVRGAFEELIHAIKMFGSPIEGVVHAFSRGPTLAARFVDLGLYIAFGGAITRQRAKRARRAAAVVPRERMLLETDAPSIGLEGVLPEKTAPCHVADIAKALADIRGETVHEIAEVTSDNAERLFHL